MDRTNRFKFKFLLYAFITLGVVFLHDSAFPTRRLIWLSEKNGYKYKCGLTGLYKGGHWYQEQASISKDCGLRMIDGAISLLIIVSILYCVEIGARSKK